MSTNIVYSKTLTALVWCLMRLPITCFLLGALVSQLLQGQQSSAAALPTGLVQNTAAASSDSSGSQSNAAAMATLQNLLRK